MEKFQLEYGINSSPSILYDMISTPSGLSEWFADDVNIKDEIYTFFWDGSQEDAKLLSKKNGESIKFHWEDHDDDSTFFEIKVRVDDLTNDVAIIITDFADEDDVEETRELWISQLAELAKRIGG
jgi:uncharacterized protein YndB with AHSA1/START domain